MPPESDQNPSETGPDGPVTDAATEADADEGVACDYCGEVVSSVRRVALDGDYERLRTRHQVQYSCTPCFEKKERERARRESRNNLDRAIRKTTGKA